VDLIGRTFTPCQVGTALQAGGQAQQCVPGDRGFHLFPIQLNLWTFGNTFLPLELDLSTFGLRPRANLGYVGDKASLS